MERENAKEAGELDWVSELFEFPTMLVNVECSLSKRRGATDRLSLGSKSPSSKIVSGDIATKADPKLVLSRVQSPTLHPGLLSGWALFFVIKGVRSLIIPSKGLGTG